jgi:hypothetical protein
MGAQRQNLFGKKSCGSGFKDGRLVWKVTWNIVKNCPGAQAGILI